MSNVIITPDPAAVFNVGRVTSYADAVKGGYTGTREEWERDLAALGTTAAEVEANRQAVAEDKAAVEGDVTTVGEYKDVASAAAAAALQSAESAHTDALAATAAKEAAQTAQGIAEEARADAVSAKEAAESAQTAANASASAATEAALAAGNAAQTATTQAGAASDSAAAAAASEAAAAASAAEIEASAEQIESNKNDIADLKGEVDSLDESYIELPEDEFDVQYTENIGLISRVDFSVLNGDNPNYTGRYTVLDVSAGEIYKVSGRSENNTHGGCFFAKENATTAMTPLAIGGYGVAFEDRIVTVPPDAVKMYVNGSVHPSLLYPISIKKIRKYTQAEYTDKIQSIEEKTEGITTVPSYWQADLDTKIPQIIENMGNAGTSGETFVFLTDAHWATNYKNSPALVREIIRRTNINKIILGGDNIIIQDSKADAMNEGLDVIKAFSGTGARLYNTFGNHEGNIQFNNSAVVTSKHLNYGEVYASQFKEMDDYGITYLNPDVDFSYYFDNAIQKTRFIILDSGEGFLPSGTTDPDNVIRQDFSSYDELHNVLMTTTTGWKVIVICHIITNKPFPNIYSLLEGNNKKSTANIYDGDTVVGTYDFTNAPATVVIAIGGHAHYDKYGGTENTRYVPWVITDCDCWDIKKVYTDEEGHEIDRTGQVVAGTTTEQAFDVVTVDYGNNVAHFIRIGTRGSNRDIPLKLA